MRKATIRNTICFRCSGPGIKWDSGFSLWLPRNDGGLAPPSLTLPRKRGRELRPESLQQSLQIFALSRGAARVLRAAAEFV